MEVKAVLFDMDGVLVHSEHIMKKAAKEALLEWGIKAVDDDFTPFIGVGEDKFVGGVAEKYGVPYIIEMKDRAYEIYIEQIEGNIFVYDGLHETLYTLKQMGYKLAVCSSADIIKVMANLKAAKIIDGTFDYIISGDKVENKKPAPDIFLKAADELKIPYNKCVAIEDALNGIQAAKAAGMHSIAITTSFDYETLKKENPDAVCESITEIIDIIL